MKPSGRSFYFPDQGQVVNVRIVWWIFGVLCSHSFSSYHSSGSSCSLWFPRTMGTLITCRSAICWWILLVCCCYRNLWGRIKIDCDRNQKHDLLLWNLPDFIFDEGTSLVGHSTTYYPIIASAWTMAGYQSLRKKGTQWYRKVLESMSEQQKVQKQKLSSNYCIGWYGEAPGYHHSLLLQWQ